MSNSQYMSKEAMEKMVNQGIPKLMGREDSLQVLLDLEPIIQTLPKFHDREYLVKYIFGALGATVESIPTVTHHPISARDLTILMSTMFSLGRLFETNPDLLSSLHASHIERFGKVTLLELLEGFNHAQAPHDNADPEDFSKPITDILSALGFRTKTFYRDDLPNDGAVEYPEKDTAEEV